jgi:hypothetical protein
MTKTQKMKRNSMRRKNPSCIMRALDKFSRGHTKRGVDEEIVSQVHSHDSLRVDPNESIRAGMYVLLMYNAKFCSGVGG